MYSLFALACLSFALSFLLSPLVRTFCSRFGLVDQPGDRKVHQHPIPRAGGIAVALSYVGAYAILSLIGLNGSNILWSARTDIWHLMPAAVSIFVIGLVDDLRGLNPRNKLIGQVGASILAYSAGLHISGIGGYQLPHWWSLPLTIGWLLLCTNAVNLIDGIDGLASGIGLFATTTIVLAALMQNNIPLAIAVVPLAGALLGFLRYNFNPATIFLGDSGSLFIGFLLGCYGILWSQKSATIIGMTAPLMALAIPLLDTSLAVVRRYLHNKPIFTADRGHIHHRLLDRGLTPRKVALLLYACCAVGALCSLVMVSSHGSGVVLVIFCAVTWIGVQHLGYVEFGTAGRMFMEGAFRRQLSAQMTLRTFEADLATTKSRAECWNVIRKASQAFGFHHLLLFHGGHTYQHGDPLDLNAYWTLRISLLNDDFIEISQRVGQKDPCSVISPFADAVYRALARNLERPVEDCLTEAPIDEPYCGAAVTLTSSTRELNLVSGKFHREIRST